VNNTGLITEAEVTELMHKIVAHSRVSTQPLTWYPYAAYRINSISQKVPSKSIDESSCINSLDLLRTEMVETLATINLHITNAQHSHLTSDSIRNMIRDISREMANLYDMAGSFSYNAHKIIQESVCE
jgi:hypothetical protein